MEDEGGMGALVLIIIIILYWIVPTDIIPDALPVGFLDDILITVLGGAGMLKAQI